MNSESNSWERNYEYERVIGNSTHEFRDFYIKSLEKEINDLKLEIENIKNERN